MLADQEDVATAFWMRAIPQIACSNNDNTDNIKGIVYYGTSTDTPDTTAYSYTDACVDEDSSDLVPYLALDASDSSWSADEVVTVGKNSDNFFRWYLNDSSMALNWQDPVSNPLPLLKCHLRRKFSRTFLISFSNPGVISMFLAHQRLSVAWILTVFTDSPSSIQ